MYLFGADNVMYTFLVGLFNGYLKGDFHHICHQYLKTILLPCNVFDFTKIVQKVEKVVITLLGIADAVLLMYLQSRVVESHSQHLS